MPENPLVLLKKTAELARLELGEEQAANLAAEIESILAHFAILSTVDVEGIDPATEAVCVDIARGGILPSQSDYLQATKGHGHGDYKVIVLAPASVQEAVDIVYEAFDLADKYLTPVLVIGDGMIGQMMEPVEFPPMRDLSTLPEKPWAANGAKGRPPNIINSLYLKETECNANSWKLRERYDEIEKKEKRHEVYNCKGKLDLLITAYGSMARICRTAVDELKREKKKWKIGVFRPITLWPYPYEALAREADKANKVLSVEMSTGQMVEDVKLAVLGKKPVLFYGETGGVVPSPDDVADEIRRLLK